MNDAYLVVWYPGRNNNERGNILWVCLDRETAESYAEKALISLQREDKKIGGGSWHETYSHYSRTIERDYLYYYDKHGETKGTIRIENYPIAM